MNPNHISVSKNAIGIRIAPAFWELKAQITRRLNKPARKRP
jgi:hypothetical protein